jgi:hypothetical protein
MSTERNRRRRRHRKSRRASRRSHRFFTRVSRRTRAQTRQRHRYQTQRGGTYAFSIPNSAVVYAQPPEDDGFSAPRMMSKEDHKILVESI